MDAKEELLSATSIGTYHNDSIHIGPTMDNMQAIEIDRNLSHRKRKSREYDGTLSILS